VNVVTQRIVGRLARWGVFLVSWSLRYRIEDPHGLLRRATDRPLLFAFWHNRIFLMPYLFYHYWRPRQRVRVAALVSASRDGGQLAGLLEQFGLVCVRGSSSRRGSQALRELARLVGEGYDIAITPDGPRGPKYVAQDGAISLAQLTGMPIIPVSYVLSRKITFNSWDNFMIPLPFTRCVVRVGQLLQVPPGDAAHAEKRLELERTLQALSAP
jgi:lysophospholipid acyltransferase (LPLAT)-like uncharacterized protein